MKLFTTLALASVLLVGCGDTKPTDLEANTEGGDTTSTPVTLVDFDGEQDVLVEVPDMHCPVACFPKVKETLESVEGVKSVTLAEQTEEGSIDNPKVIVELDGEFKTSDAAAKLKEAGFPVKTAEEIPEGDTPAAS